MEEVKRIMDTLKVARRGGDNGCSTRVGRNPNS
jgi:hypothetical protein